MFSRFKDKALRFLFPSLFERERTYNRLIEEHRKRVAGLTVADLVREKLSGIGFDPKALEDVPIGKQPTYKADEMLVGMEGEKRKEFLTEMHDIAKSENFEQFLKYLARNQIFYTAMESEDSVQANFGRATVNGIGLIRDGLDTFETQWEEEYGNSPPEEFDKHEVV